MMKRDKYRIIRDILYFVSYQETVNKTRIVYKCNLNFKNANRILNELQKMELIGIMVSGRTSNYFVTENRYLLRISSRVPEGTPSLKSSDADRVTSASAVC